MNPKTILTLLLVAATISAQAQKTVEQPSAMFANTRSVEINRVTLTKAETVLDINAYYTPGYWIKIVSDTYLQADGKKYKIRRGEGINLDSLFWMPKSGEASFKLVFEPLPENTPTFDFIESDCDNCFKIWGINLKNKRPKIESIPAEYTQTHQPETNFKASWQKGEAIVSGQLSGYKPELGNLELIYINPITGKDEKTPVKTNPDGSFRGSASIYGPTRLLLHSKVFTAPIRVAPDKESKILVNLPEIYRADSKLHKNQPPYGKKYCYAGYFAGLNTDLSDENISYNTQDYTDSIGDMDVNAYKLFLTEKFNEINARNNALNISPLAKKILKTDAAFDLYNKLSYADYGLMQAYAKKHNLSREEASKKYIAAPKHKDYNDFYQLIPYDDPDVLLTSSIGYMVRNLSYARADNNDPMVVTRYLSENPDVLEQDRALFKEYIDAYEKKEGVEKFTSVGAVFNKYTELVNNFMKANMGEGYLSNIWGTDKAFLLDLIRSQKISSGLQDFNPLTDEQKKEITALPPVLQEALLDENDNLLAKIEENKNKTGYTVLNPPTNVDEQLFVDLLKPFAGKVVLVDVWATWCGPCRAAHSAMDPMKAQFADKDVVFLYLAGEDSPENTWKNMIADIKGSHYRLNKAQWEYINKSLNVRGVPTYLILDREGNQTYYTTGFPGVDVMKNELNKALDKK